MKIKFKSRQSIVFLLSEDLLLTLVTFSGGGGDHGRAGGARGGGQHAQPDLRREERQGEAALPPLVP